MMTTFSFLGELAISGKWKPSPGQKWHILRVKLKHLQKAGIIIQDILQQMQQEQPPKKVAV